MPGGTVLQHRHQWAPVGGDCMGCASRRCDAVRAFTAAEFQAKYGFIPARQAGKPRPWPLWPLPAIILGVIVWAGQSADSAPPIIAAGAGMLVVLFVWVRR
jgi:hypothetical protein